MTGSLARLIVSKDELLSRADDGHKLLVGSLLFGRSLGTKVSLAEFVFTVLVGFDIQRAINLAVSMSVHPALRKNDENAVLACFVFDSFGTLKAKDVETDVDGVVWHVFLVVSYFFSQRRFS